MLVSNEQRKLPQRKAYRFPTMVLTFAGAYHRTSSPPFVLRRKVEGIRTEYLTGELGIRAINYGRN